MLIRRAFICSLVPWIMLGFPQETALAQSSDNEADQADAAGTDDTDTGTRALAVNTNDPPTGMVFDPTTGRYMPVADQLVWRNSFFILDNSVNHTSFDNSTLSNTRYWVQTYSLRPRWNFTNTLSLRLRQDISAELAATSVTSEHQPIVADTQLDLVEASLVTVEGVIVGVGGRLLLPPSLASRAASRLFATAVTTSATKVFAKVLSGLVTQVSGSYQHWWASGTTASGYDERALCIADNNLFPCRNFATTTAVRDAFTLGLIGQINITPEFSTGLSFAWLWQRAANLDPIDLGTLGPGVNGTLPDQSETHWRNLTSASLFVAYQFNTWFQASLGINTFSSQLSPNGTVRNPFWNPDTQYSLTAVVTMDQLYTAIVETGSEDHAQSASAVNVTQQRL